MQTTTSSNIEAELGSLQHSEAKLLSLGRINGCPICSYSLSGLPTRHRCPECGFEYDENTLCFVPWGKAPAILFAFAAVLLVANKVFQVIKAPMGIGTLDWWLDIVIGVIWSIPLFLYIRDFGISQQLILRTLDVQWNKRGQTEKRYEWKNVTSISALTGERTVRLKLTNGETTDIPRVLLPKTVKLTAFARFIEAFRERMLAMDVPIEVC